MEIGSKDKDFKVTADSVNNDGLNKDLSCEDSDKLEAQKRRII